MPVVLRIKGYRFWFYEADLNEPPPVHVGKDSAEYHPERPEPPLESKMVFTPADFCIGESGIWFFSLLWEYGKDAEPEEFFDDRNILAEAAGVEEIEDAG